MKTHIPSSARYKRALVSGIVFVALFLTTAVSTNAGDAGLKVGISASIQGSQTEILLPIRSSRIVIAPAISVAHVSHAVTDYGFGIAGRYYLSMDEARPYIGLRFGALLLKPDEGDTIVDYILGPAFGGEYFLNDHFSFAAEAQVNIAFSDEYSLRFGNPNRTNVNTATGLFATFYF